MTSTPIPSVKIRQMQSLTWTPELIDNPETHPAYKKVPTEHRDMASWTSKGVPPEVAQHAIDALGLLREIQKACLVLGYEENKTKFKRAALSLH